MINLGKSVDRPLLDKEIAVYHVLGVYRHMYECMNKVEHILIYLFRSHIYVSHPVVEIIPRLCSAGK